MPFIRCVENEEPKRPKPLAIPENPEKPIQDIEALEVKGDEVTVKDSDGNVGKMKMADTLDYIDQLEEANEQSRSQIEQLKFEMEEMREAFAEQMERIARSASAIDLRPHDAKAEKEIKAQIDSKLEQLDKAVKAELEDKHKEDKHKEDKPVSVADKPTKAQPIRKTTSRPNNLGVERLEVKVQKKKVRQGTGFPGKPTPVRK